jgi:hypothetical protein
VSTVTLTSFRDCIKSSTAATKAALATGNWQGGGGFRYYKLAPSLIVNDRWGNPVIKP